MEEQKQKKRKKSTFFADFKAFISRGNIIDLAVAVVIGGAFGKIVTSLVNDIIMPLISLMIGGLNFADLKIVIRDADVIKGTAETAIMFGNFLQAMLDFVIIAFCIFLAIRMMGKAQRKIKEIQESKAKKEQEGAEQTAVQDEEQVNSQEQAEPTPTKEELLLAEIRDILKDSRSKDEER